MSELTLFDNLDFGDRMEELIGNAESSSVEFKSAQGGLPDTFWETYSAFANTQGGSIVLGVAEKEGGLVVYGLTREQVDQYKKEFWNKANNRQFVSANLLKNEDIQEGVYQGVSLLVFNVPGADRIQKPVHRTSNPFGSTFRRDYEGDYKCTDDEIKRMIADSNTSNPQDARILEGFNMDDIDSDSLRQYRQLFASSKPDHPWLSLNDIQLLEKLGGYRIDRKTRQEGFTLAGLLVFGKTSSIQDAVCAPAYFPDYRECLSLEYLTLSAQKVGKFC